MDTPIACDMTDATDTLEQRMAEWRRLIAATYTGRERTGPTGIRLRFRASAEAWVRDLAAREKACCPFFTFVVTTTDGEVRWDISVPEDETARTILDDLYALPGVDAGALNAG
jgi:hypothetical protein